MRPLARFIVVIVVFAGSAALLVCNVRLYGSAPTHGLEQLRAQTQGQLDFLGASLRNGAGEKMQGLFPEGFFFSHALYGASWVEMGLRAPPSSLPRRRALQEAAWALSRLESPEGRAPFAQNSDPPQGIFYLGWTNWLRGGVLLLQTPETRDPQTSARFQADCAVIAQAFQKSADPFLDSYPQQSWPADSVVAVAALSLHDRIFSEKPQYEGTIASWVAAAKEHLDPETGLLPHLVSAGDARCLQGARGSSQALILRFLPEIDPDWAAQQYAAFRQQYVATFLGLPGVREYPEGLQARSDVDSGPLLAGLSLSATVVTLGAAQINGDRALAQPLAETIESFGLPYSYQSRKRYLLGLLPVGDAFLVWSKTARPWTRNLPAEKEFTPVVQWWWRLPFHALTFVLLALVWRALLRPGLRRKQ